MRKSWLAAALCTFVLGVVVPQTAHATATNGGTDWAQTGGYTTDPKATAQFRDLGAHITLTLAPGESHYINSVLSVGSASTKTEVSQVAGCWLVGGAAETLGNALGISEAGTNVDAGASVTLTSRFEFSPTAPGTYDCSLHAVFINHESPTASGHIYVLSGSMIQDAKGPLIAHAQAYQPARVLLNSTTPSADINSIASYTVPAGISSIDVISDLAVTNCYAGSSTTEDPYYLCPTSGESATASSTLTSQLFVQQLDLLGNVCHTTVDSLLGSTVTVDTHHQKLYHRLDGVPIDPTCGSLNVKVFARVTKTGGNDIQIENTNQSYSFLFEA